MNSYKTKLCKWSKIVYFTIVVTFCIIFSIVTRSYASGINNYSEVNSDYYDSEAISLSEQNYNNNNDILSVSPKIECQFNPVTGKLTVMNNIVIQNTSIDNLITIKSISLNKYIKNADIDNWKLYNTNDKKYVFDGGATDVSYPDIELMYSQGQGGSGEKKTLTVTTTLTGDKAAKLVNTTPSYIQFDYVANKRTPKAVLNSSGYLTFYYDCYSHTSEGTVYSIGDNGDRTWAAAANTTKTIVFDKTFYDFKTKTCESWFEDFKNVTKILNVGNLDISESLSCKNMFRLCQNLAGELDLRTFSTKNVKTMYAMFHECNSLTLIDTTGWDTSSVQDMTDMFSSTWWTHQSYLARIETIKGIEDWNVNNVRSVALMFVGQVKLLKLDLIKWRPKLESNGIWGLCSHCLSLEYCDMRNFDTSECRAFSQCFMNVHKCKEIRLDNWNLSNAQPYSVGDVYGGVFQMFSYGGGQDPSYLERIYLESKNNISLPKMKSNTQEVVWHYIFCNHVKLNKIYLPFGADWTTTSLIPKINPESFYDCPSLVGGTGTKGSYGGKSAEYLKINNGLFTGLSSEELESYDNDIPYRSEVKDIEIDNEQIIEHVKAMQNYTIKYLYMEDDNYEW